jgi:hypothetical protein
VELLNYLDAQRAVLRAAFDAVPPVSRDKAPAPGRWSANAIIEHLAIVDGGIARLIAKRAAEMRAAGGPFETSVEPVLPTLGLERVLDRSTLATAPERVLPTGVDETAAWEALERATAAIREAIAQADGLALATITHPHPRLGPQSLYYWIAFVGAHEARHAAQIRESVARLNNGGLS